MDIKFERPHHHCGVCAVEFRDGETLTTALTSTDEEGVFQRIDICNRCWKDDAVDMYHCHWSNTFTKKRRSPLLDADVLWQVFHHNRERAATETDAAAFLYVAALGLMRMKHLVLESARRRADGVEEMIFRTRGKEQKHYTVPDPNLDEAGIERVQERLGDLDLGDAEDMEKESAGLAADEVDES